MTCGLIAPADRLGKVLRPEIVKQDDVRSAHQSAVELFERIDLDLDDRSSGRVGPGRGDCRGDHTAVVRPDGAL